MSERSAIPIVILIVCFAILPPPWSGMWDSWAKNTVYSKEYHCTDKDGETVVYERAFFAVPADTIETMWKVEYLDGDTIRVDVLPHSICWEIKKNAEVESGDGDPETEHDKSS